MSHSAFISYSHSDKPIAQAISKALSERGLTVWIDEGELRTGDSIIERISTAIAEIDYVVAIVSESAVSSPWCQKELALAVTGGLAREHVKVLPLRLGNVAMPASLADVYYRQVDPNDPAAIAEVLAADIRAHRSDIAGTTQVTGPMTGAPRRKSVPPVDDDPRPAFEPVRLVGIVREGIGRPRNDGTRGSALYRVPFRLSRTPPLAWRSTLVATWNSPPVFTTMHRPGVCHVEGDVVILDSVTIEEVEKYHLDTLKLCVERANDEYRHQAERARLRTEKEQEDERRRKAAISETIDRLDFS